MSSVDSSFLKSELGPVLAKGIAQTVCAAPSDPIEYLGLWLQHYLEEKEGEVLERTKEEELKGQREEWNRKQNAREKTASEAIQREWKQHLKVTEERAEREARLRSHLEAFGDQLDEEGMYDPEALSYDALSDQEAKEADKEKELEMLKTERLFQRWKMYVHEMSKENVADTKLRQKVNDQVLKIYRCAFYAFGVLSATKANGERVEATPSRLATWNQVRANIKPYPFLEQLKAFDPTTVPKRRVLRVRRVLSTMKMADEAVKEAGGQVGYVIYQWLWAAVEYRCARDVIFKIKKEAGKELPGMDTWEDDPGDDIDGEEKDADEEEQRAIDEQLKQEMEAEEKEEDEAAAET